MSQGIANIHILFLFVIKFTLSDEYFYIFKSKRNIKSEKNSQNLSLSFSQIQTSHWKIKSRLNFCPHVISHIFFWMGSFLKSEFEHILYRFIYLYFEISEICYHKWIKNSNMIPKKCFILEKSLTT